LKIKIDWRRKMKNLKNLLTAIALMSVLMISVSTAKAGILMSDFKASEEQICTETKKDSKTNWGIVITSLTGIVITSLTGIVITSAADTPVDCGILMSD
jgi:hypothetical protein